MMLEDRIYVYNYFFSPYDDGHMLYLQYELYFL